jgi:hypothetical protein
VIKIDGGCEAYLVFTSSRMMQRRTSVSFRMMKEKEGAVRYIEVG